MKDCLKDGKKTKAIPEEYDPLSSLQQEEVNIFSLTAHSYWDLLSGRRVRSADLMEVTYHF